MPNLSAVDATFLRMAYEEALAGFDEGGCPIGSVLAEGERLIARGRNQRVQQGDPIAHGEMDCLRKAGRQKSYRRMTLYTSLSPCMMCTGTIIQFGSRASSSARRKISPAIPASCASAASR